MKNLLLITALSISLFCSPPRKIPADQEALFRRGGVPLYERYQNDSKYYKTPEDYSSEAIEQNIGKLRSRQMNTYQKTDIWLSLAMSKYRDQIEGKDIAIISDLKPWYATFALEYGGVPIILEYAYPKDIDPRITIISVQDFIKEPRRFDIIISISSVEHDGLGRYGEPLNPNGDIEIMEVFKNMLRKDGLLFLAVPVCKDTLFFNKGRTYGKKWHPLLLKGWEKLDSFGFQESDYNRAPRKGVKHKPVFVLTPKK